MRFFIIFAYGMLLSLACAVKPEDAGLCKLNCSSAVIGGNDSTMNISFKTTPVNVNCGPADANQPVQDAFFVQFLVSEAFDDGTAVKGKRPVPNVSIEPISDGIRSDLAAHNPNVDISGTFYNPERYKGISTPKTNWCSDSCGIVSLELYGKCPVAGASSDLGLQIHSGALYSDEITFTISTKDAN